MEYADSLRAAYEETLGQQLGLSPEQLKEISIEGLTKNWPLPAENITTFQGSKEKDRLQSLINSRREK